MLRSLTILVAAALVGAALGLSVSLLKPQPVQADIPSCSDQYNVVAWMKDGGNPHLGERVINPGMYTYGGSPVCAHLSTLDVFDDAQNQVEVGWVIEGAQSAIPCLQATDDIPHIFAAYEVAGSQQCKPANGSLTSGQYDGYRVDDAAANGCWKFYHNSDQVYGGTTGICIPQQRGDILTNGERHGNNTPGADSAAAIFDGLQYYSTAGWDGWNSTELACDLVNGYDLAIDSLTKNRVYQVSVTDPNDCPDFPH